MKPTPVDGLLLNTILTKKLRNVILTMLEVQILAFLVTVEFNLDVLHVLLEKILILLLLAMDVWKDITTLELMLPLTVLPVQQLMEETVPLVLPLLVILAKIMLGTVLPMLLLPLVLLAPLTLPLVMIQQLLLPAMKDTFYNLFKSAEFVTQKNSVRIVLIITLVLIAPREDH